MLLLRIRERIEHMHRLIGLTITLLLTTAAAAAAAEAPFEVTEVATFNEPWAMAFLPDDRLLVTEKRGRLMIVTQSGEKSRPVDDVPNVDYRGQGGLGHSAAASQVAVHNLLN